MSSEYATLSKYVDHLKNSLKYGFKDTVEHLCDKKLIDLELFEQLMNPKFPSAQDDKAAKLVTEIVKNVKSDAVYYHKFVNYLRWKGTCSKVVNLLDADYFGIKTSENQSGNIIRSSKDAMSTIK